jgi:hypothetical protein
MTSSALCRRSLLILGLAAGFTPTKPHYFTWFYFDPAQHGRADLGMSKS